MDRFNQLTEDQKIISAVGVVFALTAVLNYSALQDLAHQVGVGDTLSYLFPLAIDFFVGVSVWVTLRNKRYGEPAKLAWTIIFTFTLASIVLGIFHYPATPAGYTIAVIIPLVVFFSAELAKSVIESGTLRAKAIQSLTELLETIQQRRVELVKIQEQITHENEQFELVKAQKVEQVEALELKIEQLKIEQREAAKVKADISESDKQAYQLDGLLAAGLTMKAACELLGISSSTGQRRLENLNGTSLSKKVKE